MSQLNFDIFCLIFEEFPLEELIHFRLVCRGWKAWIDVCLARTSVISTIDEGKAFNIAKMSLSMNLDLNVIFKNRLKVPFSALKREDFSRCFHRMFPAVRQFYFLKNDDLDHRFIDLLRGWPNLDTLALLTLPDELYDPLTDYLNCLESLRTLIIITGKTPPPNGFTPEAPFLYRLERLYLPVAHWLPQLKLEVTANLIAFGYDTNTRGAQILFTENSHLNLKAFAMFVAYFWLNTCPDTEFLFGLRGWAKNLRALELVCSPKTDDFKEYARILRTPFFFEEIHKFESLSVLRVGVYTTSFFRSLLLEAAKFERITELQIFFCIWPSGKSGQMAFLKASFPPLMRSVKLIRIQPWGKAHSVMLRQLTPVIEKLLYRVKIDWYIDESYALPSFSPAWYLYHCRGKLK